MYTIHHGIKNIKLVKPNCQCYSHYLPFLLLVSNPLFICVTLISSQSNLHIGFKLYAFVISINKLPSFLLNVFNFYLILFISVLTDLMHVEWSARLARKREFRVRCLLAPLSMMHILLFYILDFFWINRYVLQIYLFVSTLRFGVNIYFFIRYLLLLHLFILGQQSCWLQFVQYVTSPLFWSPAASNQSQCVTL